MIICSYCKRKSTPRLLKSDTRIVLCSADCLTKFKRLFTPAGRTPIRNKEQSQGRSTEPVRPAEDDANPAPSKRHRPEPHVFARELTTDEQDAIKTLNERIIAIRDVIRSRDAARTLKSKIKSGFEDFKTIHRRFEPLYTKALSAYEAVYTFFLQNAAFLAVRNILTDAFHALVELREVLNAVPPGVTEVIKFPPVKEVPTILLTRTELSAQEKLRDGIKVSEDIIQMMGSRRRGAEIMITADSNRVRTLIDYRNRIENLYDGIALDYEELLVVFMNNEALAIAAKSGSNVTDWETYTTMLFELDRAKSMLDTLKRFYKVIDIELQKRGESLPYFLFKPITRLPPGVAFAPPQPSPELSSDSELTEEPDIEEVPASQPSEWERSRSLSPTLAYVGDVDENATQPYWVAADSEQTQPY
jgi:hypothetical protein